MTPGAYEVIVFANGCDDDTADRVRAFAARRWAGSLFVVEAALPEGRRHVGTARRAVMNFCAARLERVTPCGFVATTDADTLPDGTWIAETLAELADADAVGGRIILDPAELQHFDAAARTLISLEMRYRFAIARLEALRDPVAWDPWPRHAQCFGGSLAVRVDAYRAAGGLPALPMLEDLALRAALDRNDARFRHSLRVRVVTSARRSSNVTGGLSTYLGTLAALASAHRPFHVSDPSATLARVDGRAALRRILAGGATPLDRTIVSNAYAIGESELRPMLRRATTIGALAQSLERNALERRPPTTVSLLEAVLSLERYARALGPLRGRANAARTVEDKR